MSESLLVRIFCSQIIGEIIGNGGDVPGIRKSLPYLQVRDYVFFNRIADQNQYDTAPSQAY